MRGRDRKLLRELVRIQHSEDCIPFPPELVDQMIDSPSFGGVILPYVSVSEIEQFDALVLHLNSDVMKVEAGPMWQQGHGDKLQFKLEWTGFVARWREWELDHYGEYSRTGDGARSEFDHFGSEFNELLRRFKVMFGEDATSLTTGQPPPSGGPGGSLGLDKLVDLAFLGLGVYAAVQVVKLLRDR